MDKFSVKSTSTFSAHVNEPIIIDEKSTTRRIFIADLNDAKLELSETVSGTIIHQRKNSKNEWEDIEAINLTKLKGGEGVKIRFNSSQLRKLFIGLQKLYKLSEKGIQFGEKEYIVGIANEIIKVPKERSRFIKQLLEKDYGEEIWDELVESSPDLATRLSIARLQSERELALAKFEDNLDANKDERFWQDFFNENQWIFGYGLKYYFLNQLTDQPNYGGSNYEGKGNQKGDFLLTTEAEMRFTVLVEIKTPKTPLLAKFNGKHRKYRNGAWQLSSQLLGGVSQIQINCKTWWKNSSTEENIEKLRENNIYTVNPNGILVVGKTDELNKRTKVETFEIFRRNLNNPDIITFDELYQRAKFIAQNNNVIEENDNDDEYPF